MVAGKYGYYWECDDGTVSMDLEAIWGMSVEYAGFEEFVQSLARGDLDYTAENVG